MVSRFQGSLFETIWIPSNKGILSDKLPRADHCSHIFSVLEMFFQLQFVVSSMQQQLSQSLQVKHLPLWISDLKQALNLLFELLIDVVFSSAMYTETIWFCSSLSHIGQINHQCWAEKEVNLLQEQLSISKH